MSYERQFLASFDASGISPKFLPAAYGMFGQESSFGRASPNVLQVTASTAAKPGYGVAPLAEQDRADPQKSATFALQLLKAKADHAGLSFDNPADYPSILRLHNGGGDPSYVQHVAARIPSKPPETALSGPSEGTQMAQPNSPQVAYQNNPTPQTLLDAANPYSRQNISQMLLRAGAGFAGGRTFGEGLSGALSGAADAADQQEQSSFDLYKQQQLASLYGLRADTTNAGNAVKVGVAGARNAASERNADVRAGVATRGQDIAHGDKQDTLDARTAYQNASLGLRGQIANSRGEQAAALTGAPYTPVTVPQGVGQASASGPQGSPTLPPPPARDPWALPPLPSAPIPSITSPTAPQSVPSQGQSQLPPAPVTDPWALPVLPTPGGIRGDQQLAQKNLGERDRYARDHASALSDDQALLNNLEQYQGAYDRLQNTYLSKPGMGSSWRIPVASVLSGNLLGNADAAELNKQHNTLTAQLAGAKGRVLVAGLKVASASLPDQSVPYQAGNAILQSTAANTRLQQAVDRARFTLLQRNPNATPAQIESALGEYMQGVGSPFATGADGSVTPRDIPSFEQWKAGGHADPEAASKAFPKAPAINAPQAAIDYLRNNPQFSDAFDQKYGKGAASKALSQGQ